MLLRVSSLSSDRVEIPSAKAVIADVRASSSISIDRVVRWGRQTTTEVRTW